MPTTLVPTVHERLSRGNERVYVDGLITGAEVVLAVDAVEIKHLATGPDYTFIVLPLNAGAEVKAKQDVGTGFTTWSPSVIVEDALTPTTPPSLTVIVRPGCRSVYVSNVVPGCLVELEGNASGRAFANRHAEAEIPCERPRLKFSEDAKLRARMIVGRESGPFVERMVVSTEGKSPKPFVQGPLFGCQTRVLVRNALAGFQCRLEMTPNVNIGDFSASRANASSPVTEPLVVGQCLRAQWYMGQEPDDVTSDWSEPEPVVRPDARIKPEVLEAVNEGDQVIRVEGQIPGASLIIRIRANASSSIEEFGPRPASIEREIALNEPLLAGSVVSVTQTLCGVSFESDPVTVQRRPAAFTADSITNNAPVIIAPLYHGGRAVQVSNLYNGALVNVFQNGVPIGVGWAGLEGSLNVRVGPLLSEGGNITASQVIGGVESSLSQPVTVRQLNNLPAPRILGPVATGDTSLRLSNITPGSHLVLYLGLSIIGEMDAAETVVQFSTFSPAFYFYLLPPRIVATLGNLTAETTLAVPLIKSPSDPGEQTSQVSEKFREFGTFLVPAGLDGDRDFDMRIEGQMYFPANPVGTTKWPLVVVAHGAWTSGVESFKGYDYLARHLVQWGMVVFSLNMDRVSGSVEFPYQYARGEILLHTILKLIGDPEINPLIDVNSIGLVGHSMAGEGVAVAQFLNQTQSRGLVIKGVVSIAPVRYRPEIILRNTKYLQLYGSMDYLTIEMTGTDREARFSGFRIYDRAWRPKTHFWIYRGLHPEFNRVWGETSGWPTGSGLPAQDHELVARTLINAFFQDALYGKQEYEEYLEGTNLPQSLSHIEIHTQHEKYALRVDNFGDADDQYNYSEQMLDKRTNTRNLPVNASGAGLTVWEDIEHTTLTNSPHNTKGVELSWTSPDAVYVSELGSISLQHLNEVLALRLAQFYPDTALNPVATPLDLFVSLSDGTREATVRLGSVAQIPYPGPGMGKVLCPMRTVRLPIDAFKAANPELDLMKVERVMLKLTGRATGHILVDDLGFSK